MTPFAGVESSPTSTVRTRDMGDQENEVIQTTEASKATQRLERSLCVVVSKLLTVSGATLRACWCVFSSRSTLLSSSVKS